MVLLLLVVPARPSGLRARFRRAAQRVISRLAATSAAAGR
jgi:hypothetical protein